MNDDNVIVQPSAPEEEPQDAAEEAVREVAEGDRIFDITPDLNIAPSNNEVPQADTPKPTSASVTAEVEAALRQFSAPKQETPPAVKPAETSSALSGSADAPTPAPETPRVAPANPPVKTVSAPGIILPQAPEPTLESLAHATNPKTEEIEKNLGLKRLRTYEGDVEELMSRRRTSTATIAIAEQKRATGSETLSSTPVAEEAPPTHGFRNVLVTVLSLVLVAGGLIAGYYLYTQSLLFIAAPSGKTRPPTASVSSLVPADSQVTVRLDSSSPARILSLLQTEANRDQKPGTIKEIIPIETVNGATVRLSAPDMLTLMNISAPDMLARSLTDSWMLGVYANDAGTKTAFVVVSNNFFQNAFAGMLQWESVMPDDLRAYLFALGTTPSGIANATPTALANMGSTTVGGPAFGAIRGQFRDRIIHNKDVREFITDQGKMLFLYSFIDSSKLVMAGSEEVLAEILLRLENQSFVR